MAGGAAGPAGWAVVQSCCCGLLGWKGGTGLDEERKRNRKRKRLRNLGKDSNK
jgi:hypothetical protein